MAQNTPQAPAASTPLISVIVLTYQHANFIRQCLDGVLMQETPFALEVLIGDDGSSDGTTEICQQYQQQYPDIIKLFVYDRNHPDRKHYPGGPGRYNFLSTLAQVNGDYLALCEGDDYWTDPGKLHKQASFLQDNPEFSACFHSVKVATPAGLIDDPITHVHHDVLTLAEMATANCIHTPSVMYRHPRQWILPEFSKTAPVLDYLLHCFAAETGPIKFLPQDMAVYRVHADSYWSSSSSEWRLRQWMEVVWLLANHFEQPQAKANFTSQLFGIAQTVLQHDALEQGEIKVLFDRLLSLDPSRMQELFKQSTRLSAFEQVENAAKLLDQTLAKATVTVAATLTDKEQQETLFVQMADALVKNKDNFSVATYRQNLMQAYQAVQKFYKTHEQSQIIRQVKTELMKQMVFSDYQAWIQKHALREVDAEILAERMVLHWQTQPVMHCFMFLLPGEQQLLADTVDTLATQLYSNWHLTVIAAEPAPDPVFEQADTLHWQMLSEGDDPYQVLNDNIASYPEHWVSFIEPGLQYSPDALANIADAINMQPQKSFFYTDDDLIDHSGKRFEPRFKPDFNLDMLRASPYIGNGWMPANQIIALGGISALAGAENYDLALRWFEVHGEQAFGHITNMLTHKTTQVDRPFDASAGEKALMQHFERLAIPATVHAGYVDNSYRIEYQHATTPLVSIIIPTKDKLEFLQPCLESLLDKTRYSHYEILIVDNQSQDPDTFAYYAQLQAEYQQKVRVLHFDKPFNFSAMNNWAAEQARGEFLLLLNNDTEIIQPEWIDRLLNHGQRADVGVVGARLFYPESGLIQHAGVVIGMGQIADHPYNNIIGPHDYTPMERARLDQNYSAVTAAMMLVKREVYQAVNGLDEDNLAVLFNDVDFCLRVGEAGYRIVWTPFAMGVHHGSSSLRWNNNDDFYADWIALGNKKDRTRNEQRYFMQRWKHKVAHDPAFNPNLSIFFSTSFPDINAPLNWQRDYHLRLRCFGVPIVGASGDYRMRQPFAALAKAGKALCETGKNVLSWAEVARLQPDTLVVQNAISDHYMNQLRMYREFNPDAFIIFLLDDLLHDLPEKSSQYRKLKASFRDARSRLRQALSYCDRLVVSTQPLVTLCEDMIDDIHLVPNRLMQDTWLGLTSQRGTSAKPRVGWAGAQQHQGDLEMIADVVRETADEVDWVFFGMCPDDIKPYIKEEHDYVEIEAYPAKLASLNLDLAIAPLEMHNFNEAKSNLRLLEYGMMGWPVLCTDIYPYQTNNAPVTRVPNDKAAWVAAIRQLLADPQALQQQGDQLQRWVMQHYLLENHLDEWLFALTPTLEQKSSVNIRL